MQQQTLNYSTFIFAFFCCSIITPLYSNALGMQSQLTLQLCSGCNDSHLVVFWDSKCLYFALLILTSFMFSHRTAMPFSSWLPIWCSRSKGKSRSGLARLIIRPVLPGPSFLEPALRGRYEVYNVHICFSCFHHTCYWILFGFDICSSAAFVYDSCHFINYISESK